MSSGADQEVYTSLSPPGYGESLRDFHGAPTAYRTTSHLVLTLLLLAGPVIACSCIKTALSLAMPRLSLGGVGWLDALRKAGPERRLPASAHRGWRCPDEAHRPHSIRANTGGQRPFERSLTAPVPSCATVRMHCSPGRDSMLAGMRIRDWRCHRPSPARKLLASSRVIPSNIGRRVARSPSGCPLPWFRSTGHARRRDSMTE